MNKKGISGIITTVLLILIALVALSIMWVFLGPFIKTSLFGSDGEGGVGGQLISCIDLKLTPVSCSIETLDSGEYEYKIKLTRGPAEGKLSDVLFLFTGTTDQNIKGKEAVSGKPPVSLGTETYVFRFASQLYNEVNLAGIVGKNTCEPSKAAIKCTPTQGGGGGDGDGGGQVGQCNGIIELSDFDADTCTRTRAGYLDSNVQPMPVLGFHNAGSDSIAQTYPMGARYQRLIVQWYDAYDDLGNGNYNALDLATQTYRNGNMKIILTLRANHPTQSTCQFVNNQGGGNINEPESYPKDEQMWKDYIQNITDRYYVQPIKNGQEPAIAGIQLGNEWLHQFVVNTSYNLDCGTPGAQYVSQYLLAVNKSMVDLLNLTKKSMDAAQASLPNGAKKLPLVTFGITGVDSFALGGSLNGVPYNDEGSTISGFLSKNPRIIYPGDLNPATRTNVENLIISMSPYYDYLDIHLRGDYYKDHGYVARWVRGIWKQNGITGKGLSATEYATPIHIYTIPYHEYVIPASISYSLYQGFDSILWAPFKVESNLNLDYAIPGMTASNGQGRTYARDAYKKVADASLNFNTVQVVDGSVYKFFSSSGAEIGEIDVNQNVPPIPATFQQCSDGLDNDGDGQIDSADPECEPGANSGTWQDNGGVDVEFSENGIYF